MCRKQIHKNRSRHSDTSGSPSAWACETLDNSSVYFKEVSRSHKHTDAAFGHSVIDKKIFIYLIRRMPVNTAGMRDSSERVRDAALPEAKALRSQLLQSQSTLTFFKLQ